MNIYLAYLLRTYVVACFKQKDIYIFSIFIVTAISTDIHI